MSRLFDKKIVDVIEKEFDIKLSDKAVFNVSATDSGCLVLPFVNKKGNVFYFNQSYMFDEKDKECLHSSVFVYSHTKDKFSKFCKKIDDRLSKAYSKENNTDNVLCDFLGKFTENGKAIVNNFMLKKSLPKNVSDNVYIEDFETYKKKIDELGKVLNNTKSFQPINLSPDVKVSDKHVLKR